MKDMPIDLSLRIRHQRKDTAPILLIFSLHEVEG